MNLYEKYHVERGDERRELFRLLREEFRLSCGIYPGCFVHVTPSFYLPRMTYVDTDNRALRFFRSGVARRLVMAEKRYAGEPRIEFSRQDYRRRLPIEEESADLLISQFAGYVSDACGRYLRPGGILLANDSHGDAGLANSDPSFELIAVVESREEATRLGTDGLSDYFVRDSVSGLPERSDLRSYLMGLGKGLAYVKSADHYLFRKR